MPVEIRYRGIRVAAGELEGEGNPGFVRSEAPLPVGTRVVVHAQGADPREAIVSQVVEQDPSAKVAGGMKLRWAPAGTVEPAHSSTRTTAMAAVSLPDEADAESEAEADPAEVEPADSPKRTLISMPAIRDTDPGVPPEEAEPEGGGGAGGGRKRRRKQR
jgi:hypothetical protein